MRSSQARTGFTAWVENLARDQTESLAAVARREGLTGEDAMDALQEAFTSFLLLPQARTLADHREDSAALLAVLVRNAARNVVRKRQRRLATAPAAPGPAIPEETPTAATLIAAAEQHFAILGCVRKLAEIQRAVVLLRVLEEVAGGGAAAALGLGAEVLAARLQRGKDALQACIAE